MVRINIGRYVCNRDKDSESKVQRFAFNV